MDTPTRIITRSAGKKDSPDSGKKPPFNSKQKVIYLDTPTPTKGLISEKKKTRHDEDGHRRLGACSSKGKDKIGKSDKPIVDKVAQSVSSSKIKKPQVYEAQPALMLKHACSTKAKDCYPINTTKSHKLKPNLQH
ncbi:Uncharacterized protein Fot_50061 [Forsythia ovata]|uniref:Uncharacterized protein n=1 Tax=Forsythia ovata TaxID=205694 RepID=A0ABD1PX15_9LAMI